MSNSLQNFIVAELPKLSAELEAALLNLPEDKRDWSPMGNARTAINMVGECAFLGDCTDIIKNRAFPQDFDLFKLQIQNGLF